MLEICDAIEPRLKHQYAPQPVMPVSLSGKIFLSFFPDRHGSAGTATGSTNSSLLSIQRLPCSSHNTEENAEQTASLFQEPHVRSQAARRYCLGSRQHSAKFLPLLPDRHRRCVMLGRNIDGMFDQPH